MYIKQFLKLFIISFIFAFLIPSYIKCKKYTESRINKVLTIEARSKSNENNSSKNKCINTDLYVSNFMNTSRWNLIRNRAGTGWNNSLIPPLMLCIKLLDKPTNLENICTKNNFELLIIDGISKKSTSTNLATISDISKGEEKCIFISPCELLRRIYWNDKNFTNSINNLEFRLKVNFESKDPNQRLLALVSLRGLARSMKKSKDPWERNFKMTQKFKDIQAISLFIPYKPHSKSFVSDSCIIKPKITSIFYGNKPSLCSFENCMWNIWSGQLSGEFVNEHCTIGKASARGEYIVGWFSEYAIDSDTTGSVKLKLQWIKSSDRKINSCIISEKIKEKIDNYNSENNLKGNFRSSWFPGQELNITSTTTIKTNSIEVGNNQNTQPNLPITDISSTTDLMSTTTTSIASTTTTTSTTTTISISNNIVNTKTTTSTSKAKIEIRTNKNNSVRMCINGKCTHPNNLWTSCRFNRTRHLNDENNPIYINGTDLNQPQIEWIDINKNSTKYFIEQDGSLLYDVDGYIDNKSDLLTHYITILTNKTRIAEEVIPNVICVDQKVCICMLEGLVNEDITITEGEIEDGDEIDFESNTIQDYQTLLNKWLELKRIYQG